MKKTLLIITLNLILIGAGLAQWQKELGPDEGTSQMLNNQEVLVASANLTTFDTSHEVIFYSTIDTKLDAGPTIAALTGSGDACNGSQSSIKVVITGGTSPFTINYTINGVAQPAMPGYTSGSNIDLGILAVGVYSFEVTSVEDADVAFVPAAGLPGAYSITINPIPDASASVNNTPIVCNDTALHVTFNITLKSTVPNSTFEYTVSSNPATGYSWEPFHDPENGSITDSDGDGTETLSRILKHNNISPVTVTYTITPKGPGVTACAGTPITMSVIVQPTVFVSTTIMPFSPDTTVCNHMPFQIDVNTLNMGTYGVKYNWTVSQPAGVFGATNGPAGGTTFGTDIFQVINNTTSIPQKVTYTIKGYTLDEGGALNCPGFAWKYNVWVEPDINLFAGGLLNICSGGTTSIFVSAPYPNLGKVRYTWTVIPNPAIMGASDGPTNLFEGIQIGVPINQTVINTSPIAQVVRYQLKGYLIESSGMICPYGPTSFADITVNPFGQVNQPANQTVCAGMTTTPIHFTTSNTGGTTTYAWTVTPSLMGLPPSGMGDIPSFVSVNPGTSPIISTITVTPTFSNGLPCQGPMSSFTITVNPTPNPVISGRPNVCTTESGVMYSAPFVAGISYLWHVSGGIITSGSNTNSILVNWTLSGVGWVRATAINIAAGCSYTTPNYIVIVDPLPSPTVTGPSSACLNSTGNIYTTEAGMTNYQWTVTGGTITAGGGAGSNKCNCNLEFCWSSNCTCELYEQ